MSNAFLKQNAFILAGVPGGQIGAGGVDATDGLTLKANANGAPTVAAVLDLYAPTLKLRTGAAQNLVASLTEDVPGSSNLQIKLEAAAWPATTEGIVITYATNPGNNVGGLAFRAFGTVYSRIDAYGAHFGGNTPYFFTSGTTSQVYVWAQPSDGPTGRAVNVGSNLARSNPRYALFGAYNQAGPYAAPFDVRPTSAYIVGWQWEDDFEAGVRKSNWTARALVGAGVPAAVDGAVGGAIDLVTGTNNGDNAQIDFNDIRCTTGTKKPLIEWQVELPSVANVRCFVGFANAYGTNVFTGLPNCIGVGFDSAISANWMLLRAAGAAYTYTDSGVVAVAGQRYRLEAMYSQTAGPIHFMIDDVQKGGNITTNVPAAGTTFQPIAFVQTLTNAAKSARLYMCWATSQR